MANLQLIVPNLPESVSNATLIAWQKKTGESIKKDEVLVDLETDKITLEIVAPESGVLSEILKENGATVLSGDVLAIIETSEIKQITSTSESPVLSPSVRRLIHEHHLTQEQILEITKDGRVTKADILDFVNKKNWQETKIIHENQEPELSAFHDIQPNMPIANLRPEQRVPMTRLRAKIAERLLMAQQNAAMLTTFNEVNMQNVINLRNQYKERFEKKHHVKLGFMSFFVKASIEALKRFPVINASIDENDIIYHGYYDIGIAVSTEKGLIVPVLRDADQLDFAGIEQTIVDFAEKTRTGRLTYDDLKGGTFTITNGGVFGSMLSTPILNPPQSAILGMHAIKERPVVENGQIVIRPIMYLALSYDHRLVDGRDAVQFLVTIKECLESPAHLLLNI